MKVLFTFLYLSSLNLIENDHISCFLTIKYQLATLWATSVLKKCREAENSHTLGKPCTQVCELLLTWIILQYLISFGYGESYSLAVTRFPIINKYFICRGQTFVCTMQCNLTGLRFNAHLIFFFLWERTYLHNDLKSILGKF